MSERSERLQPVPVIGGFLAWRNSPVSQGPGDVAPNDPIQLELESPNAFPHLDYTVHPLASFHIEARVLNHILREQR